MTGLLPFIEVLLVVCGALASVGVLHSVVAALHERAVLRESGKNGRLRLSSQAQVVRQLCRLIASISTLLGGTALVLLPPGVPEADLVAKLALTVDAIALTGTVIVDVYVRHRIVDD